jgi:hypothetical protein
LARCAARKSVAPASRRQFLYSSHHGAKPPAGRRRYQTCSLLREISILTCSGRMNGRP